MQTDDQESTKGLAPGNFLLKTREPQSTNDGDFHVWKRAAPAVLADDVIHQGHTIHLGWMDRIRALFGRAVHLNTVTPVRIVIHPNADIPEVQVGVCKSTAFAERLIPPRRLTLTTGG